MRSYVSLLSAAVIAALAVSASPTAVGASANAASRAQGLLDSHPGWANRNADDRFIAKDVIVDADGTEHVRMDRTYRGLPVFGGDIVVHSRNGQLKSVSKTLRFDHRPDINGRLSADDAIVEAGAIFGPGIDAVPSARKVIYARDVVPTLAWEVNMRGEYTNGTPLDMTFYVDANAGNVLLAVSNVHTAKPVKPGGGTGGTAAVGTGNTLLYGDVSLNTASSSGSFNLTDTTRGGGATYDANNVSYSTAARGATLFVDADNNWGNNAASDRATVAADAHYGVATTFDYFKNVHGRNGIFGDGKGVKSYVHVGRSWVNAAWYANAMYYGDGGSGYQPLVSLDVAGHEMTHGVTQATSGLTYSGDSGGLNEATSDIFGTMVEFFANNPNDAGDYKIGEKLASSPLRYMYDPNLDGNASYDCYPAAGFAGVDPHYSSGPGNHVFYLLAEGTGSLSKTCAPGDTKNATGTTTLAGIGRDAASKIWFRALDVYFTSGTTYPQARAAALNAAADLYGSGSAQYNAVAAAFSGINVN